MGPVLLLSAVTVIPSLGCTGTDEPPAGAPASQSTGAGTPCGASSSSTSSTSSSSSGGSDAGPSCACYGGADHRFRVDPAPTYCGDQTCGEDLQIWSCAAAGWTPTGTPCGGSNSCAAKEQHSLVLDAAPLVIRATTTGAPTSFTTACGGNIASAPALVYELTLATEASFTMSVVAVSDSALSPAIALRTQACETDDSPPYCFDDPMTADGQADQTVKMDLAAGTYWFIVSGLNGTNGAFTLTAQATTPTCGDGIVNSGEQCDEGPLMANEQRLQCAWR